MSEAHYNPTEAQIEAVLAKFTPRQIAIAYLRASRRAKDADFAFSMMESVADLAISGINGNIKGAEEAVGNAAKAARTHRQAVEGGA